MELRHVVAATDESGAGHHAAVVAARLADQSGARLTVLMVHPTSQAALSGPEHQSLLGAMSRRLGAELRRLAPRTKPAFAVVPGVPGVEIPRFAEEHDSDLLVLGHKRRTQRQRLMLGDTVDAVARRSQVPCLFVAADSEALGPMLVCLDATERSPMVYQTASDFARDAGVAIRAVTVEPIWLNEPEDLAAALPTARTLRLNRALETGPVPADLRNRRGTILVELLTEASDTGAGLLAFGYHRGGPPGIVEGGSVARGLLHSAMCAVLTVPL